MTNSIFGESLAADHRGHAAGRNAVEKAASQLVSDVKYKVKKELGPNTNLNPAQVAQKYLQKLNSSNAIPTVKAIAKKKLMSEEYASDVKERVQNSLVEACSQVFVEFNQGKRDRIWIVVRDRKTGNTYRRSLNPEIARQEVSKLRANPNIASVEYTKYRSSKDDAYMQGEKTAKVKSGKGLDPVGKEDADPNNNGIENDPSDKYIMKRRNAIGAAIAAKRGVAEEFIGEVKNTKTKKEVTGKGVNNYSGKREVVKVFPNMQEQSQMILPDKNQKPVKDVVDPNERKQISTLQQFQRKEQQLTQQKFAAQKAGKVPVGSIQMNSYEPEGDDIQEVSPPGFEGTIKGMKSHKEIDNPYALAWYMKNKRYKSHRKKSGAMKEESDCGCGDGYEMNKTPKSKKSERGAKDPRAQYANDAKVKNTLRSMGLKMSYEPEGELIGEEDYDSKKDTHLRRGGMGIRASQSPAKTGTSKPVDPEKHAQAIKDALAAVRASIIAKHGKGSLM